MEYRDLEQIFRKHESTEPKYHLDGLKLRWISPFSQDFPLQLHTALIRRHQTCHNPNQSAFPASTFSDNPQGFPTIYGEGYVLQSFYLVSLPGEGLTQTGTDQKRTGGWGLRLAASQTGNTGD